MKQGVEQKRLDSIQNNLFDLACQQIVLLATKDQQSLKQKLKIKNSLPKIDPILDSSLDSLELDQIKCTKTRANDYSAETNGYAHKR